MEHSAGLSGSRQNKYNYQPRCHTQEEDRLSQLEKTIQLQQEEIGTLRRDKERDQSQEEKHCQEIRVLRESLEGLEPRARDLEVQLKLTSNENRALTTHLACAKGKLERKKE